MGLKIDFSRVQAKLENMERKMQGEVLDKAIDAGEKPILDKMKFNVPVDTSELQSHLGEIKKTGSGTNRKGIVGIKSNDRDVIERGYYQEFGHSRMVGKHWMKKSFNEAKSEANEEIKKVLIESLKV